MQSTKQRENASLRGKSSGRRGTDRQGAALPWHVSTALALAVGALFPGWVAFTPGDPAFTAMARVLFAALVGSALSIFSYGEYLERSSAGTSSQRAAKRAKPARPERHQAA